MNRLTEIKKAKYIRVSTFEQNSDRQKSFVEEGIKLYEDKESGLKPFNKRSSRLTALTFHLER